MNIKFYTLRKKSFVCSRSSPARGLSAVCSFIWIEEEKFSLGNLFYTLCRSWLKNYLGESPLCCLNVTSWDDTFVASFKLKFFISISARMSTVCLFSVKNCYVIFVMHSSLAFVVCVIHPQCRQRNDNKSRLTVHELCLGGIYWNTKSNALISSHMMMIRLPRNVSMMLLLSETAKNKFIQSNQGSWMMWA